MCWPSVTSSQKSSHTVTVEDGEMKKKKTFMHTLPSPDGPALRWAECWISDDDSRGTGNRAMRTLSKVRRRAELLIAPGRMKPSAIGRDRAEPEKGNHF